MMQNFHGWILLTQNKYLLDIDTQLNLGQLFVYALCIYNFHSGLSWFVHVYQELSLLQFHCNVFWVSVGIFLTPRWYDGYWTWIYDYINTLLCCHILIDKDNFFFFQNFQVVSVWLMLSTVNIKKYFSIRFFI